jgi:hypothetical protein
MVRAPGDKHEFAEIFRARHFPAALGNPEFVRGETGVARTLNSRPFLP